MPKNLIIKSSYSKLQNGKLKSNLGDLIRSTILVQCIGEDYIWLTDSRGKELLKWFVKSEKLVTFDDFQDQKNSKTLQIYNLENYVFNEKIFSDLDGTWNGHIYERGRVFPTNNLIELTTAYVSLPKDIQKSWQQLLVEGMGFRWEEQDYSFPIKIKEMEKKDIGLNNHVHLEWTSKHWPKENWENIYRCLKKNYSVSWQKGLNNFEQYLNWINSHKLIITCDTLGMHLASALRKKTIAIVGPTECNEFSYDRTYFIKPNDRNCMPCNSPSCKLEKSCLNEIPSKKIIDFVSRIIG